MKIKEIKAIVMPKEKWETESFTLMCRFLYRPLSYVVTKVLLPTGISPNAVTFLSFLSVVAGFLTIWLTNLPIVGWALFVIWGILDCVDGNIARIRKTSSLNGELWDAMAGYACFALSMFAVGIQADKQTGMDLFTVLGGLSSLYLLYPRLLMQKRRADLGEKSDLNNKNEYGTFKKLAFLVVSVDELPMLLMLVAFLLKLEWLYVIGYNIVFLLMAAITSYQCLKK